MTRALSVAASSHLISPEPDPAIARAASLEAIGLRRSLETTQWAEQVRQAAEVEELRSASRRRERDAERAAERAGEREPIR